MVVQLLALEAEDCVLRRHLSEQIPHSPHEGLVACLQSVDRGLYPVDLPQPQSANRRKQRLEDPLADRPC